MAVSNDDDILSFLRDETIYQSLHSLSTNLNQTINTIQQWETVPQDLNTITNLVCERSILLRKREEEERRKSQELQTKLALIHEIESLQKEIVDYNAHKHNLALALSNVAREVMETREITSVIEGETSFGKRNILQPSMDHVESKKAELESTRNELLFTTSKLDEEEKRLESLERKVKGLEDELCDMKEEEVLLEKILKLERNIRDNVDAVKEASKSIYLISKQF